jgi:hypothetical protein
MKRALCAAVVAIHLSACTSLSAGYHPATEGGNVNPGDRIVLTMRDSATHRFEVKAVTADAVCGDQCFAFSDIDLIQREERDREKSTVAAVVLGVILTVVIVAILRAAVSHVSFGIPAGAG